MIIFNMGIPRSGTVWAFNVFRELWTREGLDFDTYHLNRAVDVEAYINKLNLQRHAIVHFHEITPAARKLAQMGEVRPFFNYRDPRDVVVSLKKLHGTRFESAMQMTQTSYEQLTTAMCLPGIMLIPYDHIADHAPALVYQMATRIGIIPKLNTIQSIVEATSVAKHRKVMNEVQEEHVDDAGDSEVPSSCVEVETTNRRMRIDRTHLITDRHIQSGTNGRWRTELITPHRKEVNEKFAALIDVLGFDPTDE